MKVLLINPPSLNQIAGNNPEIIDSERGFNPPLGLLYIASYLLNYTMHKVMVVDAQVEELDYASLKIRIEKINPDVVGVTVMNLTLPDVLKTVEVVKSVNHEIKVVLGGAHANDYPEETLNLAGVDFIVLGEGEKVFADLLNALEENRPIKELTGIVFKEDGKARNNGRRPFIQDLDTLPFPARHLTPYKKYTSLLAKNELITTMMTSRGCPHLCTFCNRQALGKVFRKRSASNIVNEMKACVDMGISEFLIYDDNFTVDKERVIAICDEIIKRKLDVRWHVRAHVNTVTEEMIDRMKAAGCAGIHYGVESGSDRILHAIKKGFVKQKAKEVIEMTKRKNISVLVYFIIGLPSERLDDIKETFRFARELDADYMHMTVLAPFAATEIYLEGLKNGVIKRDYWRDFTLNPGEGFDPPCWEEFFTRDQLQGLLKEGYKSFYLRPGYILKRLLNLKTWGQFQRQLHAGLGVLKM